jgi:peptidoglycan/xylan/chitin deacetylase (PgdA/CDA1 family)
MDYAQRLLDDKVAIFLFHGVIEKQVHQVRNYTRKHLLTEEFRQILGSLKERGNAVSMDQLIGGEPLPPRAFVITFDDGFENNHSIAAPILDDLGIPATFYITSDFVDRNRMSWIDRIEWAIERTERAEIKLPWNSLAFLGPTSKRHALHQIRTNVKLNKALVPDEIASEVQRQLGYGEVWSSDDPLDQKMSWDQVGELSRAFIVGGHTHTHPIMSFLDDDALEFEITTPLRMLSERAGVTTHHFSYPEGLALCYSETVIDRLKHHGVKICPTAEDGDNDPGSDPFRLKRIMVQ